MNDKWASKMASNPEWYRRNNLVASFVKPRQAEVLHSTAFKKLTNHAQKYLEVMKERYPSQKIIIDKIMATGWPIGSTMTNYGDFFFEPEKYVDLTRNEFSDRYVRAYSGEDTTNLIEELKTTEDVLGEDKKIVQVMERLLATNSEAWLVLYPELFALIDKIIIRQADSKNIRNRSYTQKQVIVELGEKTKAVDEMITRYICMQTVKMAEPLWISFKDQEKERWNPYCRNSVAHGKYSELNYNYVQFTQLVLLFSTLCVFSK